MEYEATYLEEFLASVESLPNDVRRDFELVSLHFLTVSFTHPNLSPLSPLTDAKS